MTVQTNISMIDASAQKYQNVQILNHTKKEGDLSMTLFMDIIKGMLIGIANVIPGVSGGTMAVSMGIYDKLIHSVTHLFKEFKKSVLTLLPIIAGCGIGIIGFAYLIQFLLDKHTFVTSMAFVGLILGGLPVLISTMKARAKKENAHFSPVYVIPFVLLFAVSVGLPMVGSTGGAAKVLTPTPANMVIMLAIGIIASATMVIPGVSGSLVLMIMGYYDSILSNITDFLNALVAVDMEGLKSSFLILFPFGIGVILGIFLIAKLIEYLFSKHSIATYSAILGLIVASPFAIFYNTGLHETLGSLNIWTILFGVLLCIAGAVITYFLGEKGE